MSRIIKRNYRLTPIEELMGRLGYNVDRKVKGKGLIPIGVTITPWYDNLLDDFEDQICIYISKKCYAGELFEFLSQFLARGDVYYFTDNEWVYLTNHGDDFDEYVLDWIKKWMADHGVKK